MRGNRCPTTVSQLPTSRPNIVARATAQAGSIAKVCHIAIRTRPRGLTRKGAIIPACVKLFKRTVTIGAHAVDHPAVSEAHINA
ncbi:hypothetical protein GCM10027288_41190 [Bordetella tumbae]